MRTTDLKITAVTIIITLAIVVFGCGLLGVGAIHAGRNIHPRTIASVVTLASSPSQITNDDPDNNPWD